MIFDVEERTLPSGLKVKVRELKTSEAAMLRHKDKNLHDRFAPVLDSAVTRVDENGIEVPFNMMERYEIDIAAVLIILRIVTFDDHFRFEVECSNSFCDFGKKSKGSDTEYHHLTLSDNLPNHLSDRVHNGRYILDISGNRKVIIRLTKGKDIKSLQKLRVDTEDILTEKMIYLSEGVIIEDAPENDPEKASESSTNLVEVDQLYRVRPLRADEVRVKDVSLFQRANDEMGSDVPGIEFEGKCPHCGNYLVNCKTKTNNIPLFAIVFFSAIL